MTKTDFAAVPIELLAEQLYMVSSSRYRSRIVVMRVYYNFRTKITFFVVNLRTAIKYVLYLLLTCLNNICMKVIFARF